MSNPWPRVAVSDLGSMTREEILAISSQITHLSSGTPQCSHCGQMEYEMGRRLKRCGGCSVAMYCSKECQKNGWLGHRDFCRRSDDPSSPRADGHSFSGYPSAITLGNAIKLWVEIHNYSFTVVTNTVILLNNDIQPSDFSREIWAYLFVLDVGANSQGPDGNPAKAFQLLQTSLVRKEELGPLSDEWDEMVNHCRLAATARREEDPIHLLAAYLPAIFVMANTGLTTRHHFPVYLPRREDAFSLDGTYRSIIADAHRMCSEAMNAGDIFRVPLSGIYKHTPDLGTVVKHGKKNKWRWESRDENAYWDALSRRMTHKDSPYQSGLTPREIWARFQGL